MRGFTRKFEPLEILTEEQVESIHRGTLDILWQTGIRIEHERALKLLEKNGCKVDFERKRVHFPQGLVEESLREVPSSFRVKARDPKNDIIVGGNTVYFEASQGMQTVDLHTWEPRTATRKENYDGVTILDALPNHHWIPWYTPYFGFKGVSPCMSMPESIATRLRNSSKVIGSAYSNDSEVFAIEMAKAVGIDLITFCCASPPLTYCEDAIEAAYRWVEAGFPIMAGAGGVMGGTYPATIAGATVIGNAEAIAGIVLFQLIRPGIRVMVYDFTFPQNMKTGSPAFGAIGVSLHQVAFNQIWRKYGIPTKIDIGYSNSKKIDFQNGYERAILALNAALSGGSLLQLHGCLSGELTWHPLVAILDDDIAGMIGRFIEGIEVNNETLALDLIEEVGPIPGFYLNKEHTRKWWKKEQFVPKVADRLTYPEWIKTGKKDCLEYAKERMEEILSTHKVLPLTATQEEDVERILEEARKYYREKGLM